MRKLALKGLVLAVVIGVLGVGSYAIAGGGSKNFKGSPLNGYEENPDISTVGDRARSRQRLSKDGTSLHYKLSYSGLEGNVQQSHVPLREAGDQRRHLVLPVQQPAESACRHASLPACPARPRAPSRATSRRRT